MEFIGRPVTIYSQTDFLRTCDTIKHDVNISFMVVIIFFRVAHS